MKASQAGVANNSRVLNHFGFLFNFQSYVRAKYDGLFPEDFPTKKEIIEVNTQIKHARETGDPDNLIPLLSRKQRRMERAVRTVQQEWMRQQ